MAELKKDKRKGLIVTLLVHLIIFLVLLRWVMSTDQAMAVEDGGLMVSFNTAQSGGQDQTNEFAEASESNVDANDDDVTAPQATETVQETVETTESTDAPEVTTEEVKPVEETPKLDNKVKNRLSSLGKRSQKANSDRDQRSGDNPGDDGSGDPSSNNTGPGGDGIGESGIGEWKGNFGGFNISGGKSLNANFEEEGIVLLDICVDRKGNIEINGIAQGTTNYNDELLRLAKEAALSYKFSPKSGTTSGGCGTFRVKFDKR